MLIIKNSRSICLSIPEFKMDNVDVICLSRSIHIISERTLDYSLYLLMMMGSQQDTSMYDLGTMSSLFMEPNYG